MGVTIFQQLPLLTTALRFCVLSFLLILIYFVDFFTIYIVLVFIFEREQVIASVISWLYIMYLILFIEE